MGQKEPARGRLPREADLEQAYQTPFGEFTEWRSAQVAAGGRAVTAPKPKEKEKFKIGKLDIFFLALGLVGTILFQYCKGAQ